MCLKKVYVSCDRKYEMLSVTLLRHFYYFYLLSSHADNMIPDDDGYSIHYLCWLVPTLPNKQRIFVRALMFFLSCILLLFFIVKPPPRSESGIVWITTLNLSLFCQIFCKLKRVCAIPLSSRKLTGCCCYVLPYAMTCWDWCLLKK